ncbi:MAG: T9SS type A sorting domain-containing protein [Chitinophagaceae bacterium]|nr:T9SS type A sorting domain-containing protein [Chitinophagaceae bacterium]
MRKLYLLLACTFIISTINAQRTYIYTVASGNWNTNSIWSLNRQPTNNDSIVITDGKNVTMSGDKTLSNVIVDIFGTLTIDEPNGSSMSNDLSISTTNANANEPIVRLSDASAKIQRGTNGNGSGVIRLQINSAGPFYTKYLASETALTGPAVAYNTTANSFVSNSNGALPVVLLTFFANKSSKGVQLTWTSQQENNSDFYLIERSTDALLWQSIGKVNAVFNSTMPQTYDYNDEASISGITYYRLKIVDRDGRYGLSPIKTIRNTTSTAKVNIFPNPSSSHASIVFNEVAVAGGQVNVYNRTGQLVASQQIDLFSKAITLDVSRLTQGEYVVDVQFKNGGKQSGKLVVAK